MSESCSQSLVTDLTCFSAPKGEMYSKCILPMGRDARESEFEAVHVRATFILCISSAFTWAQEQIIFSCSVPCLQGKSLHTLFFLPFQDTQKVTDRWDSFDLQILKAVESLFLLKLIKSLWNISLLCSYSPCKSITWLWAIFPWNTDNFPS